MTCHAGSAAAAEGALPHVLHQRLHPVVPIGLRADACIAVRAPYLSCRQCAEACPLGVLAIEAAGPVIADGCIGCGRCAAACPSGALRLASCDVTVRPARADVRELYLDCWKVPATETPAHAVRVPCLGALTVSQWLAAVVNAAGRPVIALDRGWCERCEAYGASGHPARRCLDETRALLTGIGEPPHALPRLERHALGSHAMPRAIPGAHEEVAMNRRGFLRGLTRGAAVAVANWQDAIEGDPQGATGTSRPGVLAVPERQRRLALLAHLAGHRHSRLPASVFHTVQVSDRCRDHGLCAALCPTGALARYERDDGCGLIFEAAACIGCGACMRACPEQAIRVSAAGDAPASLRAVTLTRHRQTECPDCGVRFAAVDEAVCPACRKTRALTKGMVAQLFAAAR